MIDDKGCFPFRSRCGNRRHRRERIMSGRTCGRRIDPGKRRLRNLQNGLWHEGREMLFEHGYVIHLPVDSFRSGQNTRHLDEKNTFFPTRNDEKENVYRKTETLAVVEGTTRSSPVGMPLMVRAYAEAGGDSPGKRRIHSRRPRKPLDFCSPILRDKDGRLYRTWRKGQREVKSISRRLRISRSQALLTLHQGHRQKRMARLPPKNSTTCRLNFTGARKRVRFSLRLTITKS